MIEEFENRKEGRKERKRVQAQDRSKYKKSVREKHQLQLEAESQHRNADQLLERGRVVALFSEQIIVHSGGKTYTCTLRGVLKKERLEVKNLVIIGDFVLFAPDGGQGSIWQVEKRTTFLAKASKEGVKEQLIAANLDLVLLTLAVKEPLFDLFYIDRALIAINRGGMRAVLILNKVDLGLSSFVEEAAVMYAHLLIPVIKTSTKSGEGLDELRACMKDKSSLFAGPSGVGKSTLINAIVGTDLVTGDISARNKRGRHTTTSSTLVELSFGGFCVDSPGVQNFDSLKITREELDHYFSDISQIGEGCKFSNCAHVHEPGCAVKEACERGVLSPLRLQSYQELSSHLTQR